MGVFALGSCALCGGLFTFNPVLVPAVPIDPETGFPPDIQPKPGGLERATLRPFCAGCVEAVNNERRRLGLKEWEVQAGAYEAIEEGLN